MSGQFGRYRIEDEERDRGPVGRVYRAFDPKIGDYVAVKMLPGATDPDLPRRLEDASQVITALKHENIVRVFDLGQQEGVPYVVMELLRGETLDPILPSGALAGEALRLPDRINILLQVARGLQYAHSVHAIHGDIRPGNILVLPDKAVKILDFGIARILDKDRNADRAADIRAYAVLGYQLVAGAHPFASGDPATGTDPIGRAAPPPIRSMAPECPEALDNMILGLLAKNSELRPDTLEEAIQDLQAILQRLHAERAAEMVGSVPSLVEAGDLQSARKTIATVLELDPDNAEGRIWREYLSAIEDASAAQPDATRRRDAEERARLALEKFSARRRPATPEPSAPPRQTGGETAPGGATRDGDDRRLATAPTRLDPRAGENTETRLDPGSARAGWTAEERARTALARHSAKTVLSHAWPAVGEAQRPWNPGSNSPAQPLAPRRDRALLLACAAGVLCLALTYLAWSLRPVRIIPVPQQLEFHQQYGHLAPPQKVRWAVSDLETFVSTPHWLRAKSTGSGFSVSAASPTLDPGPHTGTIWIDFRSIRVVNPRISIPVKMTVTIGAEPAHLTFTYRRGGTLPNPQSVTVAGVTEIVPTVDPNAKWLHAVAHTVGANPTVRISVEPYSLAAGEYQGSVRLKDENGIECAVAVSLSVTGATAAGGR